MREGELKKIVIARPMKASRKAAAKKTGANASGKTKTTGANASGKTEETEQEVHQEIPTETFICRSPIQIFSFPKLADEGGPSLSRDARPKRGMAAKKPAMRSRATKNAARSASDSASGDDEGDKPLRKQLKKIVFTRLMRRRRRNDQ